MVATITDFSDSLLFEDIKMKNRVSKQMLELGLSSRRKASDRKPTINHSAISTNHCFNFSIQLSVSVKTSTIKIDPFTIIFTIVVNSKNHPYSSPHTISQLQQISPMTYCCSSFGACSPLAHRSGVPSLKRLVASRP